MVLNTDKGKKAVKKATKMLNPVLSFHCTPASSLVVASDGEKMSLINEWSCRLSDVHRTFVFDLFKRNMRDLYIASQWGYDEHSKQQELEANTARFLILETVDNVPVAYVHYRFVIDNDLPVLYCYEIQCEKAYQHKGLGSSLLNILENLAKNSGMIKLMATVFTFNTQSLSFFRKLGYVDDQTCPSSKDGFDYVILCKTITLDN